MSTGVNANVNLNPSGNYASGSFNPALNTNVTSSGLVHTPYGNRDHVIPSNYDQAVHGLTGTNVASPQPVLLSSNIQPVQYNQPVRATNTVSSYPVETQKKGMMSPSCCCWSLLGLIGLAGLVLGILFGVGVLGKSGTDIRNINAVTPTPNNSTTTTTTTITPAVAPTTTTTTSTTVPSSGTTINTVPTTTTTVPTNTYTVTPSSSSGSYIPAAPSGTTTTNPYNTPGYTYTPSSSSTTSTTYTPSPYTSPSSTYVSPSASTSYAPSGTTTTVATSTSVQPTQGQPIFFSPITTQPVTVSHLRQ